MQKREAAAVPEERKTESERRRAQIDPSVYIEELMSYNVFPTTGPQWDSLLAGIDAIASGREGEAAPSLRRRIGTGVTDTGAPVPAVFFSPDDEPMREALDQIAAGHGTTYLSFSRPGGDRHYRVVRHMFTRLDFGGLRGFTGTPTPPPSLLYPFRWVGVVCAVAGVLLFILLPGARVKGTAAASRLEWVALGMALLGFAAPLVAVGGSVQALTRATWPTAIGWTIAVAGIHLFARPARNAPDPLLPGPSAVAASSSTVLFIREGLVFLSMALGPCALLVMMSLVLWNR